MKLEPVNCALCGSTKSKLVFTAPSLRLSAQNLRLELRQCCQCDLVRLDPRPIAETMATLYQPQFYTAPRRDWGARLEDLILRERVSFICSHTRGKRILDVGCGNGSLLHALSKMDYDVYGLEPFQNSLASVTESLRSRVRCEAFETVSYPAENFDIITLWHVLEHLAQPVETLRNIRNFLKPDGTLILEVPNLASREARWLGPYWYNLDVPYHFWHFTPQTLQAAVQKAGFEVTTCVTSAVARPVWLLNYLLLGASATSEWWQSHHPAWRKWPRMTVALGLALCFGSRVQFAGSCPMLRLVCRKSK
jgi:2-polyprenyl-3-methyl-5-hydroxy-6-metoxy-1,4-benzoquinol methylase